VRAGMKMARRRRELHLTETVALRAVSMLEQWQCAQHRMRTVRRRIYAAHLTVCRGIIEQLEQVEIDAFPTAFVTRATVVLR
jgi:ribosomal protein L29